MLSLRPAKDAAPVLVLAIGNPARGDDALGPRAAQIVQALDLPGVDVLTDFQLQVEHALDLLGRSLVVFVDAAASGPAPFSLRPVAAAPQTGLGSHRLSPSAVLETYRRLTDAPPPPSRLLAIRGYGFELGVPLSDAAEVNLEAALATLVPALRNEGPRPDANFPA